MKDSKFIAVLQWLLVLLISLPLLIGLVITTSICIPWATIKNGSLKKGFDESMNFFSDVLEVIF